MFDTNSTGIFWAFIFNLFPIWLNNLVGICMRYRWVNHTLFSNFKESFLYSMKAFSIEFLSALRVIDILLLSSAQCFPIPSSVWHVFTSLSRFFSFPSGVLSNFYILLLSCAWCFSFPSGVLHDSDILFLSSAQCFSFTSGGLHNSDVLFLSSPRCFSLYLYQLTSV